MEQLLQTPVRVFWVVAGNRSAADKNNKLSIMLSSGYCIAGLLAVLSVGLVVAEGRLVERFIWNELQFDWPSAEVKEAALSSEQVSDSLVNGFLFLFAYKI